MTWKPTARDRRLMILYGITEEEYNAILEYQDGGCFICRRSPGEQKLAVDHDHVTGTVRGLLCWECNGALKKLRDVADRGWRAYAYLTSAPAALALGFAPKGRPGRSTRKWRTKTEKRERMEFVKLRFKEISDGKASD